MLNYTYGECRYAECRGAITANRDYFICAYLTTMASPLGSLLSRTLGTMPARAQRHKTFYGRKLHIFIIG
jgi:hypothetical protein